VPKPVDTLECYGVLDRGELLYHTIDDSPRDALRRAEWGDEDGNDVQERLLAGMIKVHRIRIEIMGEAEMPPPKPKKKT